MSDTPTLPFEADLRGNVDVGDARVPLRHREAFVTVTADGQTIITAFGATPEKVAAVLSAAGWLVYPPGRSQQILAEHGPSSPKAVANALDAIDRKGRTRTGDHTTSAAGARDVAIRAGTQAHRLLAAYASSAAFIRNGFTDEDAAEYVKLLGSCFWKRCGELREDGLIEVVPGYTRLGQAGTARIVCRITDAGHAALTNAGQVALAKAAPVICP